MLMRIPDGISDYTSILRYDSPQGPESMAPETAGATAGRRAGAEMPEPGDTGGSRVPSYNRGSSIPSHDRYSVPSHDRGGGVLEPDWDRIRRFVERYSWQVDAPDVTRDIEDHQGKNAPIINFDGDRAEFDFGRTGNDGKSTYNFDDAGGSGGVGKADVVEPKGECSSCSSRRYVDKSNDSSVSYQTPTKLSPGTAALAVGAHEREHVVNERAKASREDRQIVNQTVMIKYAICPECHKMYAAGGVTKTQSVKKNDDAKPTGNTAEEPHN